MAKNEGPSGIYGVRLRQFTQVVETGTPVLECTGPAAARVANLSILNIPRRNPVLREGSREGRGIPQCGVALGPTAAMDYDGYRKWAQA